METGLEIAHIIGFNLALLAAIVSPGPAFLYLLRMTLGNGRASGIATGCGLALMASAWTLMALLGLDGIFLLVPWAYTAFKVMGAVYLLYIAWGIWRNAHVPVKEASHPNSRAFLGGVLVNLANPKSVLFSAAVLVVVFPPDLNLAGKALIMGNHFIVEVIVYTCFAVMMSTLVVANRYLRTKTYFDRFAATVLGALGVRLMLDR